MKEDFGKQFSFSFKSRKLIKPDDIEKEEPLYVLIKSEDFLHDIARNNYNKDIIVHAFVNFLLRRSKTPEFIIETRSESIKGVFERASIAEPTYEFSFKKSLEISGTTDLFTVELSNNGLSLEIKNFSSSSVNLDFNGIYDFESLYLPKKVTEYNHNQWMELLSHYRDRLFNIYDVWEENFYYLPEQIRNYSEEQWSAALEEYNAHILSGGRISTNKLKIN